MGSSIGRTDAKLHAILHLKYTLVKFVGESRCTERPGILKLRHGHFYGVNKETGNQIEKTENHIGQQHQ